MKRALLAAWVAVAVVASLPVTVAPVVGPTPAATAAADPAACHTVTNNDPQYPPLMASGDTIRGVAGTGSTRGSGPTWNEQWSGSMDLPPTGTALEVTAVVTAQLNYNGGTAGWGWKWELVFEDASSTVDGYGVLDGGQIVFSGRQAGVMDGTTSPSVPDDGSGAVTASRTRQTHVLFGGRQRVTLRVYNQGGATSDVSVQVSMAPSGTSCDQNQPTVSESSSACGNASSPGLSESQATAGNPVNTHWGNETESAKDLSAPTRGFPLEVHRCYNSALSGTDADGLGWGWALSGMEHLELAGVPTGSDVTVVQANGATARFVQLRSTRGNDDAGAVLGPPWAAATLARAGTATDDYYTLTRPGGETVTFDAATGRLKSRADRDGHWLEYEYDADGLVQFVTDRAGAPGSTPPFGVPVEAGWERGGDVEAAVGCGGGAADVGSGGGGAAGGVRL
ncbi:MAG: DUF6531 domain-containing protein [Acidimicrobiales bacterium]